jgi:predicted lipid-binding transport protein (Tim44 family)
MGEIVVLALVTAIIVYKLFSILGQTNEKDFERRNGRDVGCCGMCPDVNGAREATLGAKPISAILVPESERSFAEETQDQFQQVRDLDPRFEFGRFLRGAERAYKAIVDAKVKGDMEVLTQLVGDGLCKVMRQEFEETQKLGQQKHCNHLKINKLSLDSIIINAKLVTISLNIESEQRVYVLDESGKVIFGSKEKVVAVKEKWTFSRHMALQINVWQLVRINRVH